MIRPVIFLLMLISGPTPVFAQPAYNSCSNPLELCPGQVVQATNMGANISFCPGCEDDFNFCFPTDNTIWFTFTTNSTGGDVQVSFSNLVFETNAGQDSELQATIIEATVPCNSGSYTPLGNCVFNATGNFTLNATGLPANTLYMVVVDGDNSGAGVTSPAECTFDVGVSGTGIDRAAPVINVNQSATGICANDVVYFDASLANCPDTGAFLWYINGVLAATTAGPIYQTSGLSDGDVVTVETSCYLICPEVISTDAQPVSVYSFSVYAGEDISTSAGDPVTLNGQTTATSYFWSPEYLFSDPYSLSSICTTEETITVALTATENGCSQIDYLTIYVDLGLEIPNTFSPNGDQVNDTWIIRGIETYPNNTVNIYDRWGQRVFQTTGYSKVKAWDGGLKGREASESVYFYVIDLLNDGTQIYKGTITVIR